LSNAVQILDARVDKSYRYDTGVKMVYPVVFDENIPKSRVLCPF